MTVCAKRSWIFVALAAGLFVAAVESFIAWDFNFNRRTSSPPVQNPPPPSRGDLDAPGLRWQSRPPEYWKDRVAPTVRVEPVAEFHSPRHLDAPGPGYREQRARFDRP